jgi:hypothetical protein
MKSSILLAAVSAAAIATVASANLRITEAMSSSNGNGTPTSDWFELTNYGSSAVSISGLKVDDNSYNFAVSVALSGITSIGAGESVIFIESAAGAALCWSRRRKHVGECAGIY